MEKAKLEIYCALTPEENVLELVLRVPGAPGTQISKYCNPCERVQPGQKKKPTLFLDKRSLMEQQISLEAY